jgi:hypothetical protein
VPQEMTVWATKPAAPGRRPPSVLSVGHTNVAT